MKQRYEHKSTNRGDGDPYQPQTEGWELVAVSGGALEFFWKRPSTSEAGGPLGKEAEVNP